MYEHMLEETGERATLPGENAFWADTTTRKKALRQYALAPLRVSGEASVASGVHCGENHKR